MLWRVGRFSLVFPLRTFSAGATVGKIPTSSPETFVRPQHSITPGIYHREEYFAAGKSARRRERARARGPMDGAKVWLNNCSVSQTRSSRRARLRLYSGFFLPSSSLSALPRSEPRFQAKEAPRALDDVSPYSFRRRFGATTASPRYFSIDSPPSVPYPRGSEETCMCTFCAQGFVHVLCTFWA